MAKIKVGKNAGIATKAIMSVRFVFAILSTPFCPNPTKEKRARKEPVGSILAACAFKR
jgi:hypothetical protein